MSARVKLVYIAGWGRSGSTILGHVLGQHDGWCYVGETRYLWDRGLIENRTCGCGSAFEDCAFWSRVLASESSGLGDIDPHEMVRLRKSVIRTRHILLGGKDGSRRANLSERERYLGTLGRLYSSISAVSGARVIVDSSKFPTYAYLLDMLPEVDLFVVHLVRDPRAVAYSWRRKSKQGRDSESMARHDMVKSTLNWGGWNHIIRSLWGNRSSAYLLVRYEDFARRPAECVRSIVEALGEAHRPLPYFDGDSVSVAPTHTVSGNPSRFLSGTIRISDDTAWQVRLPVWRKTMVTALAMPWLRQYGYSIRF